MDEGPLSEDVQAEIERIGAADVAVGLATVGPSPALATVAAAIRAGLDAHFSGHTAVTIHVDHGPSDEPAALLSQALGGMRILRVRSSPADPGRDAETGYGEGVHTVLAAGRALDARVIVMLNSEIESMTSDWLRALAEPVQKEELGLVLPVYQRSRYEGTLTHTLVVPLLRTLFGRRLLHPLAEEFGCSAEAADFFLKQEGRARTSRGGTRVLAPGGGDRARAADRPGGGGPSSRLTARAPGRARPHGGSSRWRAFSAGGASRERLDRGARLRVGTDLRLSAGAPPDGTPRGH
jgi:hypothetical protein